MNKRIVEICCLCYNIHDETYEQENESRKYVILQIMSQIWNLIDRYFTNLPSEIL